MIAHALSRQGVLRHTTVKAAALSLCVLSSHLAAQTSSAPRTIIAKELSGVSAARELSDGTLLLVDTRDQVLLAVTPGRSPRQLGRNGRGPGEYQQPTALFSLGGDTTVVIDGSARRWLMLVGTSFVNTPEALRVAGESHGGEIAGANSKRMLLRLSGFAIPSTDKRFRYAGQPLGADSLHVLLSRIGSPRVDTLRTIRGGWRGYPVLRDVKLHGQTSSYSLSNPLVSSEWATLFHDGAIAVVLQDPYRVEWILPSGQRVAGAAVPEKPHVADEQAKRSVLAQRWTDSDGQVVMQPSDFSNWPKVVPPLDTRAPYPGFAGADGRLYVHRFVVDARKPREVDVFDRSGRRVQTWLLPPRSVIVGSSKRGLYVSTPDDDDLRTVSLYAFPVGTR